MSGTTLGLPAASPLGTWGQGGESVEGRRRLQTTSDPDRPPRFRGPQCPYLTVEETVEYRHKEALEWTEKVGQGTGSGVAPPSLRATPFLSTASCPSGPLPGRIPTQGGGAGDSQSQSEG